jgi:UDP-N-acetyl-D-mannosaminuronic acid dehydrogenase
MQGICVIGLGYIGLPTASFLATKGFKVHGVDINPDVVDAINRGVIPIYEPDLDILVKAAVQSGNLKAALEPAPADVFIIAVPTPFCDSHKPDLSFVEEATRSIASHLVPGNLVIIESTIPVGTTETMASLIRGVRPDLSVPCEDSFEIVVQKEHSIFIAHCPERVLPGQILRELVENARIIGGIDKASTQKAKDFYASFSKGSLLTTDSRTAEMAKLTENAFRDVNIAFANELSIICDELNIDVWKLIELANKHPRVNILQPGPGVGGHCIAVDPWFIVDSAPKQARLIKTAREVNDNKPNLVIEKIVNKASRFKDSVITCLGLSFKPDIDDLRQSPALQIVETIARKSIGKILIVEPHIAELPKQLARLKNVELTNLASGLSQADIVALLVNHTVFSDIDRNLLKEKIVIDTRGMWR